MNIRLDRQSKTPLYRQVSSGLKRSILKGEIADGAILPSERKLADMLRVHRNTVIRAYEELKDAGLIDARQGSGHIVTFRLPELRSLAEVPIREVNWSSMIKDEYLDFQEEYDEIYSRFSEGSGISFSTGMPPNVYSDEEVAGIITEILHEGDLIPAYTTPYQGDNELILQVRNYLKTKGIRAELNQLQILSETNQALDFLLALLTEPGDAVIIEEPCSPDVYRIIRLAGCECIAVPTDQDGMVTDVLPALIEMKKPKFIYVNSSYQDPTGCILSLARRHRLLELSNRYRIPIIEDDAASELHYDGRAMPTLKSMDRASNVIYIYSFSLTFVPGLSIAVVVANEQIAKALRHLVSVRVISINWITQRMIAKCLKNGSYYQHLDEIISHNRQNRDIMCKWLDRVEDIGVRYSRPMGGVYIWVRLPDGISGTDVASEALKQGISIVPGNLYFPDKNGGNEYIRLNYSYESPEWLSEGGERLTRMIWKLYKNKR